LLTDDEIERFVGMVNDAFQVQPRALSRKRIAKLIPDSEVAFFSRRSIRSDSLEKSHLSVSGSLKQFVRKLQRY
jgi:hypothetical protein